MYTDKDIIDLYKKANKITHVMKITGFSHSKIKRILIENNIFEAKGCGGRRRQHNFNDSYFKIIDTMEKAYWLGFLWADGYITNNGCQLCVALSVNDIGHLRKFKEAIQYTGPIREYDMLTGFGEPHDDGTYGKYCRITLPSKEMVDDVKRHGYLERKSLIMKRPNEWSIPKEFERDFIRGLQDANGSMNKNTSHDGKVWYYYRMCGTVDIINYIKDKSNYITNQKMGQRKKDCPIYSYRLEPNKHNMYVLDYVYEGAPEHIRLDRKYELYMEIKNFVEEKYKKI